MKTLIALILLAATSHADVEQAKALYSQGMLLQSNKQYQQAIDAYEKSIAAEPRYVYSYKQIGTCKFELGDKPGSLAAYEKYYSAVPKDEAVKALIDRMRAVGAGGEQGLETLRKERAAISLWHSGFSLGFGVGYNMYAMGDWNSSANSYNAAFGTSGGAINTGLLFAMNGGYAFNPKMHVGLDVNYMTASSKITSSSGSGASLVTSEVIYNVPVLWLGPEFDYAFKVGPLRVKPSLGAAWMSLSGAGISGKTSSPGSTTTSSSSLNGSGFGVKAGAGADWALSRLVSFSFDVEWRVLANIATVTSLSNGGSSGSVSGTPQNLKKWGSSDDLGLDYSGLQSRAGVNFTF